MPEGLYIAICTALLGALGVVTLLWLKARRSRDLEGLVTKAQLQEELDKVRAEEKACQDHLASELAVIKQALTDGDGCFAGLAKSRSDMALSMRDLCLAFKAQFPRADLDCNRLLPWITGGSEKGRTNHD